MVLPAPSRLETRKQVEAQHAGQRQYKNQNEIDQHGFAAAPAFEIHPAGDQVFKHRDDGGQCSKEQKNEKQRAPDPPAGNGGEDIGQSDKNQVRAAVERHVKGEAGGEDDQSRHQRHAGIQQGHPQRFTGERMLLADIAAEDRDRTHADAQGEKRLSHRIEQRGAVELGKIREQVEGQPFLQRPAG